MALCECGVVTVNIEQTPIENKMNNQLENNNFYCYHWKMCFTGSHFHYLSSQSQRNWGHSRQLLLLHTLNSYVHNREGQ